MLKKFSSPKMFFLFLLLGLLGTACGVSRESWAGISRNEEGEVFVAYERFVAKLDSAGKRIWAYPDKDNRDPRFFASPTVTDDVIYVGDYTGGVHAIDRATGKKIWVYEQKGTRLLGIANFGGSTDRIIGSITLGDGILFVPSEHGVFALDRETGKRLDDWNFETDRAVWSQPLYVPPDESGAGRLYVTALDHYIYELNPENAEVLWKTDLEGAIAGSPALDAERRVLYVGTFGAEMIAVDADNGRIRARYPTNGWVWEAPAVADGTLYFGDLDGYLYSLTFQGNKFQENWVQQLSPVGKIRATPLLTDELVIVGSHDSMVYAVKRASGELVWDEEVASRAVSPLLQVTPEGEPIVVTALEDTQRMVIGLRLDTGTEVWSYKHED